MSSIMNLRGLVLATLACGCSGAALAPPDAGGDAPPANDAATPVDAGGPDAPERPTTAPMAPTGVAVAWTGAEYGVLWGGRDDAAGAPFRLHLTRLDARGERVLGDAVLPDAPGVANAGSPHVVGARSLVWNGREFGAVTLATSGRETRALFRRIDALGAPVGTVQALSTSDVTHAMVAWEGDRYAVVARTLDAVVYASVNARCIVTHTLEWSGGPAFAALWTGTDYRVIGAPAEGDGLVVQRLSTTGGWSGEARVVATATRATGVSIARQSDGEYGVAWTAPAVADARRSDVWLMRFGDDDRPVGRVTAVASSVGWLSDDLDVATTDEGYALAWVASGEGGNNSRPIVARVPRGSNALGLCALTPAPADGALRAPALAWNPERLSLGAAWSDPRHRAQDDATPPARIHDVYFEALGVGACPRAWP